MLSTKSSARRRAVALCSSQDRKKAFQSSIKPLICLGIASFSLLGSACVTGTDVAVVPTSIPLPATAQVVDLNRVPPGLTQRQVRNGKYRSQLSTRGEVAFTDGRYVDINSSSKNKTEVHIDPVIGLGDFSRDGFGDAAFVLVSALEGHATFYELHALRYDAGKAIPAGTLLLGQDLKIKDIQVQLGLINVVVLTKSPLSTEQTPIEIESLRSFRIERNQLVENK